MATEFYTSTGARPDLVAAISPNPPENYIGGKIVPTVFTPDLTGTIYYADLQADVAAQTGRTTVVAPTSTTLANATTTWTCAEAIKRGKIAPNEVKSMGGIEKADLVGAKFAIRSVMNAVETAIATITTGSAADATFDAAKFLGQAQTGLDAIRQYYGKTTLLGSTIAIKRVVQALLGDGTYGPVLSRIVSGTSPAVATAGVQFEAWKNAIAMLLGVDQVLCGDDTIWNAGDSANKIVIGKFDDGSEELIHKYEPVFARNMVYLPDGQSPFYVESIADRLTKANCYDAWLYYNVISLNANSIWVLDGIPA